MFGAGDRVGVAVSGGADSVALLHLLEELRPTLGMNLAVLHFNHQLRGAESDADEQFVASLASQLKLELFTSREDVASAARANGWNLEDAGRRLRYAFFSSVADAGRVVRVAVAHTADDQAETVLARLLRGTGPAGLASIYPVKGCIVRPLLGIRRHELRADLARRGQSWREDSSNQDATRLRAKLRHHILPTLERDLQPAVVSHLGRLAHLARADEAFWQALVAERLHTLARWEESGIRRKTGRLSDDVDARGRVKLSAARRGIRCADLLAPLPWMDAGCSEEIRLAVTRRLVRGIIEELQGHCQEITAQHVEQVLHLAIRSSSGQRTSLPGIVVERSFDWIWFAKAPAAQAGTSRESEPETGPDVARGRKSGNAGAFSHVITLGAAGDCAVVAITEIGRCFRLKVIDWPAAGGENITVLDRDLLRPPLVLRSWRPGDSFRPQGRRSVHKLKYFLLRHRVEARDRAGWPVLTSAGALVWTRGMPVAAEVAPGSATRTGVVIVEEEI